MKALILGLLISVSICHADEVILKNGFKIMNVQFIDSTSEYVTVMTKARERKIPISSVVQVIRKRYDMSYNALTDSINSGIECPPQNSDVTTHNSAQLPKDTQALSNVTYDRIIFIDGKKAEGKITSIKTDVVIIEDSETRISFEYAKSEIDHIITAGGKILSFNQQNKVSENVRPVQQSSMEFRQFNKKTNFKPFAGVVIPMGDYSSTEASNTKSGYAKTGYTLGAEIISDIQPNIQYQMSFIYYSNAVDAGINNAANISIGNYHGFNVLGGLRFITTQSSNQPRFHIGARIGLYIGSYPSISIANISVTSNNPAAFAYNFTGGIVLNDKVDLSIQYLAMTPKYVITNSINSNSLEFEQPTNLLLITIGIYVGN